MGVLRLVLALCVVLAHSGGIAGYFMIGGEAAVQCFYILSGFFIALVLNEKYSDPAQNGIFYFNRGLRIYSLYWLFLAATVLLNAAIYAAYRGGALRYWAGSDLSGGTLLLLAAANLAIVGLDVTGFVHPALYRPLVLIPQAWSLSLELMFYLIAPFVVRRSAAVIALVAALCLAARIAGHLAGLRLDPWSYRFFPFELGLFLAGALSYKLYAHALPLLSARWAGLPAGLPFAAILVLPVAGELGGDFFEPARLALLGAVALGLPALFFRTGRNRLDRALGELSYPVYLSHFLVITVFEKLIPPPGHPTMRTLAIIAATLLLSWAAVRSIDLPIDAYRQRRARRAGVRAPALHMAPN